YLLPFEITSLLILMAIVGAITLARRVSSLGGGRTRLRAMEGTRSQTSAD
ncbi:hypothetical protein JG638_18095, partial [Vibrio cholerae]|nr:hypothetical protein [Vibrio cholerae]